MQFDSNFDQIESFLDDSKIFELIPKWSKDFKDYWFSSNSEIRNNSTICFSDSVQFQKIPKNSNSFRLFQTIRSVFKKIPTSSTCIHTCYICVIYIWYAALWNAYDIHHSSWILRSNILKLHVFRMISNRILGGPSLILDQSVGPIMDKNRLVSNLVDTDEQYFEGPQHSSRRVDSKAKRILGQIFYERNPPVIISGISV